jgi:hypothetical protein
MTLRFGAAPFIMSGAQGNGARVMRTSGMTETGQDSVGGVEAARGFARRLGWSIPCALMGALLALSALAPGVRADSLFDNLMGSWAGSGQIRYDDGQSEGIRCNAYYKGGGEKLNLAIRCRSATTEVEIRGQLTADAGKLSGTWEERTFNASGEANGRVAGDKLSLSVTGGGFKGAMSVAYGGTKQTVMISTEGIRMRSVNVTLAKS